MNKKGYNTNGYPSLFHDEEEHDLEAFITYFISWTLRCAVSDNEKIPQNIKTYASNVLFELLDIEVANRASYQIKEVKTWKEWKNIDLCVEVELSSGNKKEFYAIAIELKMYTTLREKQFEKYIDIFEEHYKVFAPNRKISYVYLSGADYANEQDEQKCENLEKEKGIKMKVLTVSDLKATFGTNPTRTGNALFDEFWFDYYTYKKTT